MMYVIHGDDIASSRKYLQNMRDKSQGSKTLLASSIDMTALVQLFESDNLFSESSTFFIEDLLTKKKQASDLEAILKYLSIHAKENDIYLWEGKEVGKAILKRLPNATNLPHKLPQSMFQFLDSLSPKNKSQSLLLFHKTIATAEPELVFFMLIRHFRLMLALYDTEAQIDEVKRMAPWQKSKLKKQAVTFSKERLAVALSELHKIDFEQKTGATPMPFSASIDIFLMNL